MALLILTACSPTEESPLTGNRLAPCSAEGTIFATIPFKDWATEYHTDVDRILEEHVESLRTISTAELRCTEPTLLSALQPSPMLRDVAKTLAPWKSPARLQALSQLHVGPVLLEFLRVYECANLERGRTLSIAVLERQGGTMSGSSSVNASWQIGDFQKEEKLQQERIDRELRIARPSLERALVIAGSMDDLRGISVEIECMKRLARDMDNVFALAADASSCLSRVPGKASLRDRAPAEE